MRVREVRLENFKSYVGSVRVGPFRNFTCIVGPNGAGKSNLVDAVCFVLAVETRALRSQRLQGLIHREAGEAVVTRTAVVELVLEERPEEHHGPELRTVAFRRVVLPGVDGSRFFVDGAAVSQADYLSRLEGLGIFPKARNFLVLQGDVQKTARQQGRDLTALLEEVSGSSDLRQEYEQLAAEKSSREDAARHLYAERRSAVHEKQRVAQQKREAVKYEQLERRRRQLQVESYLYQLSCCGHRVERQQEQLAAEERSRAAAAAAADEVLQCSRDAEQRRAELHLAAAGAERRAREVAEHAEGAAAVEKVEARMQALRQRLKELEASRANRRTRRRELEAQAERLREQRTACGRGVEALATADDAPIVVLTPDERQEFERLRDEAAKRTAGALAQLRDLEAQLSAFRKEHATAEQDTRELEVKQEHLRRRVEELEVAVQRGAAALDQQERQAQERRLQLDRLTAATQARSTARGKKLEERGAMLSDIQDIAAAKRQLERVQRLVAVTEDLKRAVPGVHGRIVDLCAAAEPRFKVAVNVALSGHADGVVADSTDQAKQCIQHLKAKMLESLTFLPLDNLRVQPLDRRVGDMVRSNQRLRLAINCLTFQSQDARAFEFLLGDVVLADDLSEARRFFFEELRPQGLACRVVTLQGEVISRDGNMAIASGASQEGNTCFDFADLGRKKARLDRIDARLAELDAEDAAAASDRTALAQELERGEAQTTMGRQALERERGELAGRSSDLTASEHDLVAARQRSESCKDQERDVEEQHRSLEAETHRVSRQVFAELSRRKGLDDIAAADREDRQRREERRSRRRALEQQRGRLEAEVAMIEQTLAERGLQDPAEAIAEVEGELQELQVRREAADAAAGSEESARAEAEAKKAEAKAMRDEELDAEREAARLAGDAREARARLADAGGRAKAAAGELRAARDGRLDVLRQAVLEDVELPFSRRRCHEELRQLAASAVAASQALARDEQDPAAELCGALDWNKLPEGRRHLAGLPEGHGLGAEYRSDLVHLAQELERLRPNLKAAEELAAAAGEVAKATEGMARAQRSKEEAEQEFVRVQGERTRRFKACFSAVSEQIGQIYKKLTSSPARGIDGGTAILDLEDENEPFNGGVKFMVMPPGKRLSDVAWLSGGEKTLAAMALLFALQAFRRPPFLVLDEIDAHLDQRNLQALATFMAQSACQAIVVSLKDKFFCESEALIGVTRNPRLGASVVFTADLALLRGGDPEDDDHDGDGGGGGACGPSAKLLRESTGRPGSSPMPLAAGSPLVR